MLDIFFGVQSPICDPMAFVVLIDHVLSFGIMRRPALLIIKARRNGNKTNTIDFPSQSKVPIAQH
jgi:hypothetical protein